MLSSQSNATFFTGLAVNTDGTAYSLANNGATLVKYHVDTPFKSTTIDLSGDVTSLSALDFRPATGELFGYDDATDSYVKVNTTSGSVTSASGDSVTATNTTSLDMDWNPTIDRLRTVTETDQNIVYNPDSGEASDGSTTSLFYAEGDMQQGVDPSIVANAYTNSVANAQTTQQYALDHASNTLVTLDNNAGTLSTIGMLTTKDGILDFNANAGLDVVTDASGNNIAYASLTSDNATALYTLDLNTASATMVGIVENEAVTVGADGGIFSSLGLDGNNFGIEAGSDIAIAFGLA